LELRSYHYVYFGKKDGYFLKILQWVDNLICFLKNNKTILIIINNKVFDES